MFGIRFAVIAAVALITIADAGSAHEYEVGSLTIGHPWARATPGGAKIGAGYLTITNKGTAPDRLVGGSLSRAGRVEVHEMKMQDGVMKMREAPGVEIKPGETVQLAPGGYHLMFIDLTQPLKQGEMVKGELRFEKAGTVAVEYTVGPIGASAPPSEHDRAH